MTFALHVHNLRCAALEKWEVVEFSFPVDMETPRPFDVEFGAVFKHAGGNTLHIPGFYNGNRTWLLRFCPPDTGQWAFKTYSTLPVLSGKTGEVVVSQNPETKAYGPIEADPDFPQKFRYANGSAYFMMAFELDWLFALDAENSGGIPKTKKIVETVKENGFNQIVMNVYAYDAPWGEKEKIKPENNYAKPAIYPFGGTNNNPDHKTLNPVFFQRLDRVIAYLNEQEIAARIMIYVWNKFVSWPAPGSEADNMYFDYIVKRYQAYPNIIWDIAKEALSYGYDDPQYISDRINRLRRLDAHKRLLTVHSYEYCKAFPGKVDFISIPDNQPYLYYRMREIVQTHPSMPVVNIEHGAYEKTMHSLFDGAYTAPLTCLDRMYQCIFAGTYSNYYWQNAAWYNVIIEPLELPEKQRPHFHYYKNIQKLFAPYNFNQLYPVQNMFAAPMLTNGSDTFIFYLPESRTRIAGRLPELAGKTVEVTWFDPLKGNIIPLPTKPSGKIPG